MTKNYIEVVVNVDAKTRNATAQLMLNGMPQASYPVREIKVEGTFYISRRKGLKPGTKLGPRKKRAYNRKTTYLKVA